MHLKCDQYYRFPCLFDRSFCPPAARITDEFHVNFFFIISVTDADLLRINWLTD